MQPNAEETRRRKNLTPKTAAPSSTSDSVETKIHYPYKPKDNLPDIYAKFTQQLQALENDGDDDDDILKIGEKSKILEIIQNSPVVIDNQDLSSSIAKASSSRTRRTLFNYFSPASQNTSTSQSSVINSNETIPETQETPAVAPEDGNTNAVKPTRLTRRNSMTPNTQTVQETSESMETSLTTPVRLTRRKSFTTPSTPIATPAKTARKTIRKTMFPSVEEEPSTDSSNMNLTNIQSNNTTPVNQRTTCYAPKSIDMTQTPKAVNNLDAIMTTPLARVKPDTLLSSVLRRKTMYTPQLMQESFVDRATEPEFSTPTNSASLREENVSDDLAISKPVARRRTLFTPNRVVEYRRDRILESEQLLNHTQETVAGNCIL